MLIALWSDSHHVAIVIRLDVYPDLILTVPQCPLPLLSSTMQQTPHTLNALLKWPYIPYSVPMPLKFEGWSTNFNSVLMSVHWKIVPLWIIEILKIVKLSLSQETWWTYFCHHRPRTSLSKMDNWYHCENLFPTGSLVTGSRLEVIYHLNDDT